MDQKKHFELQKIGWSVIDHIGKNLRVGMREKTDGMALVNEALEAHGLGKIWHPSVLKFEGSTLTPGVKFAASDETTLKNIAIVDIGIVIDGMEIDCGKTFGFTPEAKMLAQASEQLWSTLRAPIESGRHSPRAIYEMLLSEASKLGYAQIAPTAGHRLGPYPTPKRDAKISATDEAATFVPGGWMVEIHISDGTRGAFFEELLYL